MYKVEYLVDGAAEDTAEVGTEKEALSIAAEWARDARNDADYIKNDVSVVVEQIIPIAEFPVKKMEN